MFELVVRDSGLLLYGLPISFEGIMELDYEVVDGFRLGTALAQDDSCTGETGPGDCQSMYALSTFKNCLPISAVLLTWI